jgi:hypothetical protein
LAPRKGPNVNKPARDLAAVFSARVVSPAREALSAALSRKEALTDACAVHGAVLDRVGTLVTAEAEARAKLDRAQAEVSDAIAAWAKAGGVGEPPSSPDNVLQLRRDVEATYATAEAARRSIPGLRAEAEAARSHLSAAHADVVKAARAVALEEAVAVSAQIAAAYQQVRALKVRLNGLGEYMVRNGGGQHANQIRVMIDQPEPQPTQADVNASRAVWQQLGEALFTDPDAQLKWE